VLTLLFIIFFIFIILTILFLIIIGEFLLIDLIIKFRIIF